MVVTRAPLRVGQRRELDGAGDVTDNAQKGKPRHRIT